MVQKSLDFFKFISYYPITMQNTEIPTITQAIEKANSAQIDCLWAILKYKEIGILRKIKCMSELLQFNLDRACQELPVNENGYIVDFKTRHLIHDILLEKSRNTATRS
jgi:hypothetical protein